MSRQTPQTPRFRPVLDQFAPYKPGKPPSATGGRSFKLSSNESPFGPLPSVVKVIAEAAGDINRYPDNGAVELTEAIATQVRRAGRRTSPSAAARSAWSSSCSRRSPIPAPRCSTRGARSRRIRTWPTWPVPGRCRCRCGTRRTTWTRWPPRSPTATRLIFICTPNNPTGTAVAHRRARPVPRPGAR